MDKKRLLTEKKLNVAGILTILAGTATLFPLTSSSDVSILGYRALCSFSPISSILLLYTGWMTIGYAKRC